MSIKIKHILLKVLVVHTICLVIFLFIQIDNCDLINKNNKNIASWPINDKISSQFAKNSVFLGT